MGKTDAQRGNEPIRLIPLIAGNQGRKGCDAASASYIFSEKIDSPFEVGNVVVSTKHFTVFLSTPPTFVSSVTAHALRDRQHGGDCRR